MLGWCVLCVRVFVVLKSLSMLRLCVCSPNGRFRVLFLLVLKLYSFNNAFCLQWFPLSLNVGLVCFVCACFCCS